MKNIFLALLVFAGTTVMAQSGSMKASTDASAVKSETLTKTNGKEEIQKSLELTDSETDKVWALQQKYCGPDAYVAKSTDVSAKKDAASMEKMHKEYYAALLEVIPAEKADKLMAECKMACDMDNAKSEAKSGKSCCPQSASKKTCKEKK